MGKTLGKRIADVEVVDENSNRISTVRSFFRTTLKFCMPSIFVTHADNLLYKT